MRNKLMQLFRDNLEVPRTYRTEVHAEDDQATIFLYDAIGDWLGISAEQFVRDVNDLSVSNILLRINSPGGDVFDARAMHTALRQHKAKVTTQIDGLAASAATTVALAGDRVEMVEGGFFMIHNAWSLVMGNAAEMREFADVLEKVDGSIRRDYAAKTGLDDAAVGDFMAAETWFDSAEALEHGFVDGLAEGGTADARFNLSAYAHAPEALTRIPESPAPRLSNADMARRLALYERTAA